MDDLVYPRERTLGAITLVLGILGWLALIVGTVGIALIGLGLAYLVYLFAHSTLIAHIKGNGVELSPSQFPDLYEQFVGCCDRLQLKERPQVYILNGNGDFNAFATKFLRTQYVILLSDIVDAMEKHPDGVRFYIGHELGHLRMKHLTATFLRWPVLWLPLVGAAYSRARESTCDRHGRARCATPQGAVRSMAALAAGSRRWEALDLAAYGRQVQHSSGFWMSFHELTSGYPWITKRALRLAEASARMPGRNAFAYVPALFVPYAGRLGGGFGLLVMVYIVGVLAAIAIPSYQDYIVRAKVTAALSDAAGARTALSEYYATNKKIPESLEAAGVPPLLAGGGRLSLDRNNMALTVSVGSGELILTPRTDAKDHIVWTCTHGGNLKPMQVPPSCRGN